FYSNKKLNVDAFGNAAKLAMDKLIDDPQFNMAPMLTNFHTRFFDEYAKTFPFELLPESTVLENATYKAFKSNTSPEKGIFKDNEHLPYQGYKVLIRTMNSGDEKELMGAFPQADGVMVVYIDFELRQLGMGGMGIVTLGANANIHLINKEGKKVFAIRQNGKAKGVVPMVAGVPVL